MKKAGIFVMFLMGVQLYAQEGPLLSSAVIAERNNDIVEAKSYIDKAEAIISAKDISQVKEKDASKYYYYKGLINFKIYNSDKPEIHDLDADALEKAYDAFTNLLAYEKKSGKERNSADVKSKMPYVANAFASRGIEKSKNKDFLGAYEDFIKTYDIKKSPAVGTTDTSMLYNAALMAQNAKLFDKAIAVSKQLIEMGYKGQVYKATAVDTEETHEFSSKKQMDLMVQSGKYKDPVVEGDIRSDIYVSVAGMYMEMGDTVAYNQYVSEGREKFPNNEALLRAELQQFLDAKAYDKAMVNLDQAIEKDPNNKLFHYIKGFILQTEMNDLEAAKAAYAKSSEADPTYIEPLYMQGLIHVDAANAYSTQMNQLGLNETSKYSKLEALQKEEFKKALPFFEKVYAIDAKDRDTLEALKEVYYKLKMYEDAKRITAELGAL